MTAMVSDNAVEEIKQRLDIVEHISEYVELKRSGTNYKGLCPFHNEKTSSFMVSPEKQIFHCFGCGEGGDAIGFTMKYDGLSFPEALEVLGKKTGVEVKRSTGQGPSVREGLKKFQAHALEFYVAALKKNAPAMKYLKERGIEEDSMARFSLGFAPDGWQNMEAYLRKKGAPKELMLKCGLLAEGRKGPYDIFRNRIMFPIFDLHGEAIAFGGRVMDGSEPKYLNSPDTDIFRKGDNLYALNLAKEGIRKDGHSVVVEGYMDAIMCHQYGITSAVAPLGTALTEGHLKKLRRYSERVVLIFDGDRAGISAARRSLDLIMAGSMRARVLVLPEGEDPDSILKAKGEAHLRGLMEKALSPVEFVLRHSEKEKELQEAAGMIAKAADPLVREQLIRELADLGRISEGAIREKLRTLGARSYSRRGGSAQEPAAGRRSPVLKAYNEETLLLSAAVASPGHCPSILERLSLKEIADPVVRGMLEKLSSGKASEGGALELAESEEEKQLVTHLSVSPGFELEHIDRNIEDCIIKINRRSIDRRIEEAKGAGDFRLLQDLLRERQELLKGQGS